MKPMQVWQEFSTALRLVACSMALCCGAYPTGLWLFGRCAAPHTADGSLIRADGRIVGSRLVAQAFTEPGYFRPRPSAVAYDAAAAGGSNLSPHNPLLRERAVAILAELALAADVRAPADLIAASGSGLDPHITRAAAEVQAPRVAAARELPVEVVLQIIAHSAEPAGPFVEPLVNVLELNVALDAVGAQP